ncbi:MAG: nucleoside deaminase [Planctomycetota bacterium]|nr:MAG: nucleoside deaminase [Planctomycetota bacterium]
MQLEHERYMRRAIALTKNAPQLPFGSVIVRRESGDIAAEGWNKTTINPTWHGEMDAVNALFRSGQRVDGSEFALYTTAEPCPMCMAAVLWSGIQIVVFGTSIRFLQARGWRQIDVLAEEIVRRSPGAQCTIVEGVLQHECNRLFAAGPP